MPSIPLTQGFPAAASMDLNYRLPPMQQVIYTPTILISAVLLAAALIAVVYLANRSRRKAKDEARREALRMAEKILVKRGGTAEDADRMLYVFQSHPEIDPAASVMLKDTFHGKLRPLLDTGFGQAFGERMEKLYFPPPKDTRRMLAVQPEPAPAEGGPKAAAAAAAAQPSAAILDLMDATLRPGTLVRLVFQGVQGGHSCLVMGHDMQGINLTLPANNDKLVAALKPGTRAEGTLESGPSLMAFNSTLLQAVAGSMPYCRISPWSAAWEVRKRDSVRFPVSLDIQFQHIATSAEESIRVSNLSKEIGTLRPGKLIDLSLGGCCIETPSDAEFAVGDMIRFSKSLVAGNPPATLLGAVVQASAIDPRLNGGCIQLLRIQFLVIDDVSQRILVRTLRQLQDVMDRNEWIQAQQLMQKMRRNKIQNIGSPAVMPRKDTTRVIRPGSDRTGRPRPGTRVIPRQSPLSERQNTSRTMQASSGTSPKPARTSTRILPRITPAGSPPSAVPGKPPADGGGTASSRRGAPGKPDSGRGKAPL